MWNDEVLTRCIVRVQTSFHPSVTIIKQSDIIQAASLYIKCPYDFILGAM